MLNHISISTLFIPVVSKEELLNFLQEIEFFFSKKVPTLYEECLDKDGRSRIKKLIESLIEIEDKPDIFFLHVGEFATEVRNRTKRRTQNISNSNEITENRICIFGWPAIKEKYQDAEYEKSMLLAKELVNEAWIHLTEFYVQFHCKILCKNRERDLKNKSL